jgi:hypothetical protein
MATKRKLNAIETTMPAKGMMGKGIAPSRSMVEKKYPMKKSTHGEHDPYCYQRGPQKR